MIKLIALDIDGTLTDDRKQILPRTKEVLMQAEEAGTRLVLASARPTHGLYEYRDLLQMEKYHGFLMAYNGGRIVDASKEEVLSEIHMDLEETRALLKFLEKLPVTVILDDGAQFYVTDTEGYKVEFECRNNRMECQKVPNLAEFLFFEPVKLLLSVLPERIMTVQGQIADYLNEYAPELNVVRTAAYYLEIFPRAINKGKALEELCRKLNIDLKDTMAFGDSENDIPMLQMAGTGVAMGNAEDAVKAVADFITVTNNEDGIAEALLKRTE